MLYGLKSHFYSVEFIGLTRFLLNFFNCYKVNIIKKLNAILHINVKKTGPIINLPITFDFS